MRPQLPVALALLALLSSVGRPQTIVPAPQDEAPPPPRSSTATITVKTSIVAITALVRDKDGNLIRDLDKKDFVVKEDGKTQNIRYFDKDNDLPLQIGLMLDTSGSQAKFFKEESAACETFLKSMLTRPQDQAFVVRFDNNVLLLQKLTDELPKLEAALGLLSKPFPPAKGIDPHAGTRLYDAIVATSQQVIGKERGRRAVVILTDGEDNGSTYSLEVAQRMAQKADTAVYTVLYTDSDAPPGLMVDNTIEKQYNQPISGRLAMQRISLASGGRIFVVRKNMPVEKIFEQIESDMRYQYRLGYTPAQAAPGGYHTLEVKTTHHPYNVQARIGYYTPE